jgi:TatD DNase family protein
VPFVEKKEQMLIDAHVHVDRFEMVGEGALASALDEINSHKIFTISNSMDLPSYERNRQIAEECEYILPIFGIHPWNASKYVDRLEDLEDAIDRSSMIGEIGLDFYFVDDESEYPNQRKVLEYFFAVSKSQNKIVNLHTKGAEESILDLLKEFDLPRVIIHWYSGPIDVFNKMADMGFYFTIGIEALYSEHIQEIARIVPSDQLLTETDNPGGPKDFIGGSGTPRLIEDVVDKVAELRNAKREEIISLVQSNLLHLIGDDPWFMDTDLAILESRENGA